MPGNFAASVVYPLNPACVGRVRMRSQINFREKRWKEREEGQEGKHYNSSLPYRILLGNLINLNSSQNLNHFHTISLEWTGGCVLLFPF